MLTQILLCIVAAFVPLVLYAVYWFVYYKGWSAMYKEHKEYAETVEDLVKHSENVAHADGWTEGYALFNEYKDAAEQLIKDHENLNKTNNEIIALQTARINKYGSKEEDYKRRIAVLEHSLKMMGKKLDKYEGEEDDE